MLSRLDEVLVVLALHVGLLVAVLVLLANNDILVLGELLDGVRNTLGGDSTFDTVLVDDGFVSGAGDGWHDVG